MEAAEAREAYLMIPLGTAGLRYYVATMTMGGIGVVLVRHCNPILPKDTPSPEDHANAIGMFHAIGAWMDTLPSDLNALYGTSPREYASAVAAHLPPPCPFVTLTSVYPGMLKWYPTGPIALSGDTIRDLVGFLSTIWPEWRDWAEPRNMPTTSEALDAAVVLTPETPTEFIN